MVGFLDNLFSSLDIENLEKDKVKEYLINLLEIAPQVHSIEEQIKLFGYRVRLDERLIDIDYKAVRGLNGIVGWEDAGARWFEYI